MNKGEKTTTQRIPLTNANGGLSNRQITLKEMVIKEKKNCGEFKNNEEKV